MLHTKFRGNSAPMVLEKILSDFNINVHGGYLGHVTSIISVSRDTSPYLLTPSLEVRDRFLLCLKIRSRIPRQSNEDWLQVRL